MRANSGGLARPYTQRIIGLTIFNHVGIHWFDYLPAKAFNMPEEYREGVKTLVTSHRLNTGYAPRKYLNDFTSITQPLLVVVRTDDDAFIAEKFLPEISPYTNLQVTLLRDVTHMGVVVGNAVQPGLKKWLEDFDR